MAKDRRLFAKFDLDYADHPKIDGVSDAAFRAHVTMILYSRKYMTDGIIPKRFANRFGTESLTELLTNDENAPSLIALEDGSYLLHDYSSMNDTRADIERRTRVNIENGRRGGLAKKRNAKQTATESVSDSGSETSSEKLAEIEIEIEKDISPSFSPQKALEEAFEVVWKSWPKKVEKKSSCAQFVKHAKKLGVDVLSEHVRTFGEAYAATTERQYVPSLAVWLRGERWTDDLPSLPQQSKPVLSNSWMDRSNQETPRWMQG